MDTHSSASAFSQGAPASLRISEIGTGTHAPNPSDSTCETPDLLGQRGPTASAIGPSSQFPLVLGGNVFGWTADRRATFEVLDRFLDAGGTHLDTSDSYMAAVPGLKGGESETLIGEWISSRRARSSIFLATKVGSLRPHEGLSRKSILHAVDDSLRRLQTDYIDLYWAHRDDPFTPQEETVEAFDALVTAGKVRHLGASNFSPSRLAGLVETSRFLGVRSIEAVQPEFNLLDVAPFEIQQGPVLKQYGLVAWTYHSLAAGFLTGKYRAGQRSDQTLRSDRAMTYAGPRGDRVLDALAIVSQRGSNRTIPAVALAWLACQPNVMAPIASARNLEQLNALLPVGQIRLDADELNLLRVAAQAGEGHDELH